MSASRTRPGKSLPLGGGLGRWRPTTPRSSARRATEGAPPRPIGEENPEDIPAASDLFDPETIGRVVLMQNVVPAIATVGAFLVFRVLPLT